MSTTTPSIIDFVPRRNTYHARDLDTLRWSPTIVSLLISHVLPDDAIGCIIGSTYYSREFIAKLKDSDIPASLGIHGRTPPDEIPAVLCAHANECPTTCPRPPHCYCRRVGSSHACRSAAIANAVDRVQNARRTIQIRLYHDEYVIESNKGRKA